MSFLLKTTVSFFSSCPFIILDKQWHGSSSSCGCYKQVKQSLGEETESTQLARWTTAKRVARMWSPQDRDHTCRIPLKSSQFGTSRTSPGNISCNCSTAAHVLLCSLSRRPALPPSQPKCSKEGESVETEKPWTVSLSGDAVPPTSEVHYLQPPQFVMQWANWANLPQEESKKFGCMNLFATNLKSKQMNK